MRYVVSKKLISSAVLPLLMLALSVSSCIEPPLDLPAEEVLVDMPAVQVDLNVVWGIEAGWEGKWYYGWDDYDRTLFGDTCYTMPTNYEVRRYYLGQEAGGSHTSSGTDGFTIFANTFRRSFQFGYYDLLVWSNIDSDDGTQVLLVDDSSVDSVRATTTATRGLMRNDVDSVITGIYNQPEPFFSAYEQDLYISRYPEDYDYYDADNRIYVKQLSTTLRPLVYIYLVQVILHNNDGRVTGVTGDGAISAMANATSVNTGHTSNTPCVVYFPFRMKKGVDADGETVDIAGGKLTTFGLCDLEGWQRETRAQYHGMRSELDNRLYITLRFSNGTEQTLNYSVKDQCQAQCHGGVITLNIDCSKLTPPSPDDGGTGNLFVPTIEDYDNVSYDIPM